MKNKIFSVDKPAESPGFLLWQTTITWQRQIKKALDPFHISHAQFVILAVTLWFAANEQDVTQIMIIRQSKLDKMTVSKSLKKLVDYGLVQRMEDKTDTRAKAVTLTKKGRELIAKLVPIVEKIDRNYFGVVKKSDQKFLLEIFNKMITNSEAEI